MRRVQLIGVFALLGTVVLHALPQQQSETAKTNDVKISGCVTQAERTGSLARPRKALRMGIPAPTSSP